MTPNFYMMDIHARVHVSMHLSHHHKSNSMPLTPSLYLSATLSLISPTYLFQTQLNFSSHFLQENREHKGEHQEIHFKSSQSGKISQT